LRRISPPPPTTTTNASATAKSKTDLIKHYWISASFNPSFYVPVNYSCHIFFPQYSGVPYYERIPYRHMETIRYKILLRKLQTEDIVVNRMIILMPIISGIIGLEGIDCFQLDLDRAQF
jgi:hypothetical protein